MPTRQQVVDCALSFEGTPFSHQGREKGKKVDCVGIPLMVAGELKLLDINGQPLHGDLYKTYSPDPAGQLVLQCCQQHLVQKTLNTLAPGDILVMRVETLPCHAAIYVGLRNGVPHIVHAYSGGFEKCVVHELDTRWRRRVAAVFEFPGIED